MAASGYGGGLLRPPEEMEVPVEEESQKQWEGVPVNGTPEAEEGPTENRRAAFLKRHFC